MRHFLHFLKQLNIIINYIIFYNLGVFLGKIYTVHDSFIQILRFYISLLINISAIIGNVNTLIFIIKLSNLKKLFIDNLDLIDVVIVRSIFLPRYFKYNKNISDEEILIKIVDNLIFFNTHIIEIREILYFIIYIKNYLNYLIILFLIYLIIWLIIIAVIINYPIHLLSVILGILTIIQFI